METQLNNSATEAYLNETILLVRSLVIKSELVASIINKHIVKKLGQDAVDSSRPWTWKYYLNISGQYHSTDQMMKVTSLDTHEEIDFTLANLEVHTATAKEYRYGTRYYFSLARKYPNQIPLILSITNPVPMQEALDAVDGKILTWDKSLVQEQEDTLIYELEEYTQGYFSRYVVVGFNNLWDNYPTMIISNLYMSMVSKVMNIRLKYCKTEKTHMFHMRQYLASHGDLDRYIPYLTLEQVMYLYHNIDRLRKNAGKTEIFEELIHWILYIRRIPLSDYTVNQLQAFGSDMLPILSAKRIPLSTLDNSAESAYVGIDQLYEKEAKTQPGNEDYFLVHKKRMTHELQTAPGSTILTKDLESAMVDYTNAVPDPLPTVLMRQWAYMANNDLYNVVVGFNNPATAESFTLLAKDALTYYCYVFLKSMDLDVPKVPTFLNVKYRLNPLPPREELYRDIPDEFPEMYGLVDAIWKAQPFIRNCASVTQFWDLTYNIYNEHLRHWFQLGNTHDPLKRGALAKIIGRMFGLTRIDPEDGASMTAWLNDRNLPEYDLTADEAKIMMRQIFENATGFAVDDTKTLKAIQKALLELFGQLSSYAIQFMRDINDSDIIPLNWAAIRVGFESQSGEDLVRLEAPVRILDVTQEARDDIPLPLHYTSIEANLDQMVHEVFIKAPVDIMYGGFEEFHLGLNIPAVRIMDPTPTKRPQWDRFFGQEYYDVLTAEQRLQLAINQGLR